MKLYDNDEYREKFMELVYSLLQSDGTNDRSNLIIDAFDRAPEVEAVVLPPNDPLTMEELRELDGEPVWGAFSEGSGRYMIIQWHNSEFFKTFECGFLLLEEYGKTWMAYRRKPETVKT